MEASNFKNQPIYTLIMPHIQEIPGGSNENRVVNSWEEVAPTGSGSILRTNLATPFLCLKSRTEPKKPDRSTEIPKF